MTLREGPLLVPHNNICITLSFAHHELVQNAYTICYMCLDVLNRSMSVYYIATQDFGKKEAELLMESIHIHTESNPNKT